MQHIIDVKEMKHRTDFPTALTRILRVLGTGNPYTLNKLAEEARLNFRTVKKSIDFLSTNQTSFLDKGLDISSLNNVTVVRLKEKASLSLYPANIQQLIIRTVYYPTMSREEEILAHLFMKGAIDNNSAMAITQDKVLRELIDAEHVAVTYDGLCYLTEDGKMIAEGALKLYPELERLASEPKENLARETSRYLSLTSIPIPPIILKAKDYLRR
jgi:hypothetical protein